MKIVLKPKAIRQSVLLSIANLEAAYGEVIDYIEVDSNDLFAMIALDAYIPTDVMGSIAGIPVKRAR